ncbi:MAG: hypothetical protein HY246_05570 [Proteobacteria bacterium]|nr:hypothetical protein [Pseudomonadota bacterium]
MSPGNAFADLCQEALDQAQKYIDGYENIRRLTVDEQRGLVKAICTADDDDRASVARDAGERVQSDVRSNMDALDRSLSDARDKLKAAASAEQCRDKQGDLNDKERRMQEVASRIDRMAGAVRGGNNPVISKLREIGQLAHSEYQSAKGNCALWEYSVGSRRADCIRAESDVCWVVEVKPNSSAAVAKGREQARDVRDILNNPDEFKKRASDDSRLAQCAGKKFRARVDCYVYCPEIDDEGQMRSASMGWSTCDQD